MIIKHGGGMKWSIFYEEAIRVAFLELIEKDVKVDKTENQVVARFRAYENVMPASSTIRQANKYW